MNIRDDVCPGEDGPTTTARNGFPSRSACGTLSFFEVELISSRRFVNPPGSESSGLSVGVN